MTEGTSSPRSDDTRLRQIIADYFHQLESGAELSPQSLLEQHPELVDELKAFFAQQSSAAAAVNDAELPTLSPRNSSSECRPSSDEPITSDNPTITPSELSRGGESATAPLGTKVRYFGDYELLEEIARGGMGVVYKARQVSLNRIVALKMILAGQLASEDEVQRFHTEAEAAAKLDHPGIVPIFEVGEHEGQHYFSMGFVEGQSLAEKLTDGPLPTKEAAELTKLLAETVAYAHEQAVIHRDLKPANVLLDKNGQVRITDFGLAKKLEADSNLTGTGQILGTPSYMPPEQAAGRTDEIGAAADIYALGAVLYTMLTGRPPFQAANPMDTLLQVLDKEPVPLRQLDVGISRDLETICLKCLEKEPHRRYASADELAAELKRFLADQPIQARPLGPTSRAWRWCRRNPVVATLGFSLSTILLILAIVGPLVAIKQTKLAEDNQALANKERDARNDVEEQLHTATALRLAAQSQLVRDELPVQSLLLAIEATEATRRHSGAILPLAHQTLQDGLAGIGGRPLGEHKSGVNSVAISPDSRWLVTASREDVRLWDLTFADPEQEPVVLIAPRNGQFAAVAISPDNRWLATGSGYDWNALERSEHNRNINHGMARLWDLTSADLAQKPLRQMPHKADVTAVTFSADARWLVTVSRDRTARLWDLTARESAALPVELKGHEQLVFSVAGSPDGRWLVTGSADKTARLWDLTAKEPAASAIVLTGHEDAVYSVAIGRAGRWVVTGSEDHSARLWDLTAKDPAASSIVLKGHKSGVRSVAISTDGHSVVSGGDDSTARLWDLTAKDPATSVVVLRGHGVAVTSVAISPDSRWLATGSYDKTARLWDLTAKDPASSAIELRGHESGVTSVAMSPDGRWLVTASDDMYVQQSSGIARLWDLTERDPAATAVVLRGHEDVVTSVAISPDGRWAITGSGDKTARLWDLTAVDPAASPIDLKGHESAVFSVAVSPDGHWLATGSVDGTALLWELTAKDPASSPIVLRGHEKLVSSVVISPDGRWLVTGSMDKTARLWDLTAMDPAASPVVLREHEQQVMSVAISPDGRWLVTGSGDKTARLWDLTGSAPAASCAVLSGHEDRVVLVAISPDGRWLVTGSEDNTARLWDLTAESPAASPVVLSGHERGVTSLAISPNGRWLVTGSSDSTARLWDLTANNPADSPVVLRGHGSTVSSVAICPNGRWLVTGSSDSTARLWDLTAEDPAASPVVLRGHAIIVPSVAITPDSRWIVTGSYDRTARLWDLSIDSLVDRARWHAGRELTPTERKQYLLE